MKVKSIIFLSFMVAGVNSYAQNQSLIHASIPVPILKFGGGQVSDFLGDASIPTDDYGYAGTGLGFGYSFYHPLNESGMFLSFGADVYWNPIKSAVRKEYVEDEQNEYLFSHYFNVPLHIGLGYQHEVNESLRFSGSVSPIINVMKVTKSKSTYYFNGSLGEVSTREKSYNVGTSLGIGLEGNSIISDKYILGVGFSFLGTYNLTKQSVYTYNSNQQESPEVETDSFDWSKSVSLVTINFGIIITNK